jgi:hypothetical protein
VASHLRRSGGLPDDAAAKTISQQNARLRAAIDQLDHGHTALNGQEETTPPQRGRRPLTWDREGISATCWATEQPHFIGWEDLDDLGPELGDGLDVW